MLVDTGEGKRKAAQQLAGTDGRRAANRAGTQGSSHGGCKGMCAKQGCAIAKPKRSQLHCGGSSRYFHLPCFMDTHVCRLMPGAKLVPKRAKHGNDTEERGEEKDQAEE